MDRNLLPIHRTGWRGGGGGGGGATLTPLENSPLVH